MRMHTYGVLAGVVLAAACGSARASGWTCPAQVADEGHTTVPLQLDWPGARAPDLAASAGKLGPVERTGRGGYSVSLALPHVAAPLEVKVAAVSKGRTPALCSVRVLPTVKRPGRATSEGPLKLSGPADLALVEGTVRITAVGTATPPTLRVTAGSVFDWAREGDHWVARYELPAERVPQVVLFAAVGADGALVDWLALPMSGVARVEAVTEPNALVRFEVGPETFGPVRTGRDGRATMVIRAPPGVTSGKAIANDRLGNRREEQVAVSAPPFQRVLAVCARTRGTLELVAVDPQGAPALNARFRLEAQGAKVAPVTSRGHGRYVAPLSFDPSGGAVKVLAQLAEADPVGAWCELPPMLVVRAAPVVAPPPPPPPPPPEPAPVASRFTLAPRLGYLGNAGALSSAVVMVDLDARLGRWVSLGLEVGGAWRFAHRLDSAGEDTISGHYVFVPLLARASAHLLDGAFGLSLGPSGGAALISARESSPRVGASAAVRTLPAFGAHLGLDRMFGPGRVVLEATYLRGFASGQPPLNAVFVTGGYRFGL